MAFNPGPSTAAQTGGPDVSVVPPLGFEKLLRMSRRWRVPVVNKRVGNSEEPMVEQVVHLRFKPQ